MGVTYDTGACGSAATLDLLTAPLGGWHFDLPAANGWERAPVKGMTGGVAYLFKANGVTWVTFTSGKIHRVDLQHDNTSAWVPGRGAGPGLR